MDQPAALTHQLPSSGFGQSCELARDGPWEWCVGFLTAATLAPTSDHRLSPPAGHLGRLPQQPRLSNAGFAAKHQERWPEPRKVPLEELQLSCPANQRLLWRVGSVGPANRYGQIDPAPGGSFEFGPRIVIEREGLGQQSKGVASRPPTLAILQRHQSTDADPRPLGELRLRQTLHRSVAAQQ